MTAPAELRTLATLSAELGDDITLVQGGGGNTSIKDRDTLWVKASGFWLSQATEQNIFVPVALTPLRAAMAGEFDDSIEIAAQDGSSLRPSIETTLHAALPHRVVIHVHSVNAIAWTVQTAKSEELAERLDGLRWSRVPYARPGVPLTRAVRDAADGNADLLLLDNHGLVLGAGDCRAAEALLRDIEKRLAIPPRRTPAPRLDLLGAAAAELGFIFPRDNAIHAIACGDNLPLALGGPLYPDHLVFLGADVPVFRADGGELRPPPDDCPFLLVEDAGVIVRRDIADGALAMLKGWSETLSRIAPGAEVRTLTDRECGELLGWEAEDYRKKLGAS